MKIHILFFMWGDGHTKLFLEVALPNLLAKDGLAVITQKADPLCKIYTSTKDGRRIRQSPLFKKITDLMPVEFVSLDHLFKITDHNVSNALLVMTKIHKIAVDSAIAENAAMLFMPPDQVFSEGALGCVMDKTLMGKRVVALPAIRLTQETFTPELLGNFTNKDGSVSIAPRDLVALGMKHFHPITKSLFTNSDKFNSAPTHIYFSVDETGFIAHCLHMHTLMIKPVCNAQIIGGNFDTSYLKAAVPDFDDYYIINNSDEAVTFEISPRSKVVGSFGSVKLNTKLLSRFLKNNGDKILYKYIQEPVTIHSSAIGSKFHKVKESSGLIIHKALPFKAKFVLP